MASVTDATVSEDHWAAWLRRRRSGGNEEHEARTVEQLTKVRERILDNADLAPRESLLDVGCGNGLVAFGALARDAGRVVFADVSRPLLKECRSIAADGGVLDRCEFVEAPADALEAVADASVDVVTTRSVLIYVRDKERAFAEFFRVLRPGGRVSLFEPINTFGMQERRREFFGLDLPDLAEIGAKLEEGYGEEPPESNPMNFDERDLVVLAEAAGFFPIHLDLRLDVEPWEPRSWHGFLHSSPNPNAPMFAEALERSLNPDEAERFVAYVRPLVEQGLGRWRMGHAFLWAHKPG
jgi:arsenite methyltransferase